ncbi:MAG TPA: hypothetical protein VN947_02505 [Polyangia bacterium]|nr:hypothetical protein [Polyangia bacterium]
MSEWLNALRAAPSPPSELLEFAATQPSLAATWQNATRGDWVIWMAANGFGHDNSPRDVLDATVILADYSRPPLWRLAMRFRADDEDVVRRIAADADDFDLTQVVAYVNFGGIVGGIVGFLGYSKLAGHSLVVRELAGVAVLVVVAVLVTFLSYRIFKASLLRHAAGASIENSVPRAVAVATRVSLRSNVMKQIDGARIVRKRLDGPIASAGSA